MRDLASLVQNLTTGISKENTESSSETALAESTLKLVNDFSTAKILGKRTTKAISFLIAVSDEMKDILIPYISNLKHIRGKYQKSCKELIKTSFKGLSSLTKIEKEAKTFALFRNKGY